MGITKSSQSSVLQNSKYVSAIGSSTKAPGPNVFVVVKSTASYTSTDGVTWTAHTTGSALYPTNVVWNPILGIFVGADNTTISTDGATWYAPFTGYGGEVWTGALSSQPLVLDDGDILVSGQDAQPQPQFNTMYHGKYDPLGATISSDNYVAATNKKGLWAYSNSTTASVISYGTSPISTPTYGYFVPQTYSSAASPVPTTGVVTDIMYFNNMWMVIVASTVYTTPTINTASPTWTSRGTIGLNTKFCYVPNTNEVWAIAPSSNTATIRQSSDGITWNAITMPASLSWKSIAYGNGTYVAVSSTGVPSVSATGASGSFTNGTAISTTIANWGLAFGG